MRRQIVFGLLALTMSGCIASAQLPGAAPPPFSHAIGPATGLTPELEAFLKKLFATYQNADSYRDTGRVTLVQQTGRVKTTTEMPMELAFKRPNFLLLDAGQYVIACDGTNLSFTVPELGQHTQSAAPQKLEKKHLQFGTVLGGTDEGNPDLIDMLIGSEPWSALRSHIERITQKPDATVGGTPCRVIEYETVQRTKATLFVDPKRMLLVKVEGEASAAPRDADAQSAEVSLTYEMAGAELNPAISRNFFARKPAAASRRVAEIGADANTGSPDKSAPEGAHLIGRTAPVFEGKDATGKPITKADLQVKTVLLFFWGLSAGEHALSAIPVVQAIADEHRGRKDFLVLGVNGENEPQLIAQLLERKKASFRNVVDDGLRIQRSYELGGLPTFALIGRDGKVRWARLGAPPNLRQELSAEIRRWLDASAR